MSTNHTPNYQLSQWEATDKVLRADFNADNAKIDAALAGKLGRPEIIKHIAGSNSAFQVCSRPFPDMDWNDWEYICVLAYFPPYEGPRPSETVTYHIHTDGNRKDLASIGLPGMLVVLFPLHNSAGLVSGFVLSNRLTPFSCDFSYESIEYMSFNSELNMYLTIPDIWVLGGR